MSDGERPGDGSGAKVQAELGRAEAERIALIGERDAAARGGLLLAVDAEEDANLGWSVGATLNLVAPHLAEEHGDVSCGVAEIFGGDVT